MKKISYLVFVSLFTVLQPICQADSAPTVVPPTAPSSQPNTQPNITNPASKPQTAEQPATGTEAKQPKTNPASKPQTAEQPATGTEAKQPKTNEEIRQWYNDVVGKIPSLNEQWINEKVNAEERAKRAHEIRHNARLKAREMMPNKGEVADLRSRDQEKYGNPDGPTFEYLVEKNRQKGLKDDAVYEDIIGSSNRTNREYNEKFGVKKEAQSP